jgi:cell division protease FtsH
MNKQTQFHIGYWLAAVLGILMLQYVYAVNRRIEAVPYSQFQQLLRDGKVEKVAVSNRFI